MKSKVERLFSMVLILIMCFGMINVNLFAQDTILDEDITPDEGMIQDEDITPDEGMIQDEDIIPDEDVLPDEDIISAEKIEVTVTGEAAEIQSIEVLGSPEKLYFVYGSEDLSAYKLNITYTDSTTQEISLAEAQVTGLDFHQIGEYQIQISYGEKLIEIDAEVDYFFDNFENTNTDYWNGDAEYWSITDGGQYRGLYTASDKLTDIYSGISYEPAQEWSNYRFSTDITLEQLPSSNGTVYPRIGLYGYSLGTTYASQRNTNYEFRIYSTSEGYTISLYKTILVNDKRTPASVPGVSKTIPGAYEDGAERISFSAEMEFSGSMIRCYIDGEVVIEYDTDNDAKIKPGTKEFEEPLTEGTVGFHVMRDNNKYPTEVYTAFFDNVKVTAVEKEEDDDENEDEINFFDDFENTDTDYWNGDTEYWSITEDNKYCSSFNSSNSLTDVYSGVSYEPAQQWKNYSYSTDVIVEKVSGSSGITYPGIGLYGYSKGTTFTSQRETNYEFRITPKANGYNVVLYKTTLYPSALGLIRNS
jgi:hypothetical protein